MLGKADPQMRTECLIVIHGETKFGSSVLGCKEAK